MKHWKYLLAAMLIVGCLAGCRKDKVKPEYVTLSVQFEDGNGTKAYMTPYYMQPKWEVNDTININGKEYKITKRNELFIVESVTTADTYNAYFYADEKFDVTIDGGTVSFPLNDRQNYSIIDDTTIKYGAPMVATSSNLNLTFKNTCAVLAIQIKNSTGNGATIESIAVTDSNSHPLNGTLKSNFDGTNCYIEEGSIGNSVELNCENTQIANGYTKTFFIYVPPVTGARFSIRVNSGTLFSQTQQKTINLSPGHYVKVPITIKKDQPKK